MPGYLTSDGGFERPFGVGADERAKATAPRNSAEQNARGILSRHLSEVHLRASDFKRFWSLCDSR